MIGATLRRRLAEQARTLKAETLALYFAARDPRTPWSARLVVTIAVAYALSPIDLIPDFIPVLGLVDDLILLPLLLTLALRLIPPQVLAECRDRAATAATSPSSRWGGIMIFMIWLTLGAVTVWWAYDSLASFTS